MITTAGKTHTAMSAQRHTQALTHTCTRACVHTNTHTFRHTAQTHTHTHTKYTNIHTHIHPHTDTHIQRSRSDYRVSAPPPFSRVQARFDGYTMQTIDPAIIDYKFTFITAKPFFLCD